MAVGTFLLEHGCRRQFTANARDLRDEAQHSVHDHDHDRLMTQSACERYHAVLRDDRQFDIELCHYETLSPIKPTQLHPQLYLETIFKIGSENVEPEPFRVQVEGTQSVPDHVRTQLLPHLRIFHRPQF